VWTGSYVLTNRGANRLINLLKAGQPDLSKPPLLDAWISSKVRDAEYHLDAYVWADTNDLFLHGDERKSNRMAHNGGWERPFMYAYRTITEQWLGQPDETPCKKAGTRSHWASLAQDSKSGSNLCPRDKMEQVLASQESRSPCVGDGLPIGWKGRGPVKMEVLKHSPQVTKGLISGELLVPWDPITSPAAHWKRSCSRLMPKIIHFIWIGSAMRVGHARRIANYALRNMAWKVMLWVDVPFNDQPREVHHALQAAESRPAGPIQLMLVQDWAPCFRHARLLELKSDPHGRRTNPSNLLRIEIVYLFGGIYTDTDSVADHAFDDYGALFRHPFGVSVVNDVCNCMFGFDRGNSMLDFALSAAVEGCTTDGAPCTGGSGPVFWTGVFLAYQPTDVVLFDWSALLFPTVNAVTHHTWDGSWNLGHTSLVEICKAVGWDPVPPKDPFNHAMPPPEDKCRRLELWLRWLGSQLLRLLFLLVIVVTAGCCFKWTPRTDPLSRTVTVAFAVGMRWRSDMAESIEQWMYSAVTQHQGSAAERIRWIRRARYATAAISALAVFCLHAMWTESWQYDLCWAHPPIDAYLSTQDVHFKVMLILNHGHMDLFRAWLVQYRKLALPFPVIVVAEDELAFKHLQKLHPTLTVERGHTNGTAEAAASESEAYKKVMGARATHILRHLSMGTNLLFADVGAFWKSNPLRHFAPQYDLWMPVEKPANWPFRWYNYHNAGFMGVRSNVRTINLVQNWERELLKIGPLRNQKVLHDLLVKNKELRIQSLPHMNFPSGYTYFHRECKNDAAVVVPSHRRGTRRPRQRRWRDERG